MLQANPRLTPNLVKAILQYTARSDADYGTLQQGAGFLDVLGAVRLSRFYALNQAWQPHAGRAHVESAHRLGQPRDLGRLHQPARQCVGHQHRVGHGAGHRRQHRVGTPASADNIVWGTLCGDENCSNIVWGTADSNGANIVWGTADNIVWGTTTADNIVWGTSRADNIVWGTSGGVSDNIVWGTACGGDNCANIVWGTQTADNIVWGTVGANDNIVWGTADNIVWGTFDESGNIVWGTAGEADNIVWGTADNGNIVWGTVDNSNIVWGTATADNIVWGTADNIVWGRRTTSCGAPLTRTTSSGQPARLTSNTGTGGIDHGEHRRPC